MADRYIDLKWGGQEFGSFGVEDFASARLGLALIAMTNFHMDWVAEENGSKGREEFDAVLEEEGSGKWGCMRLIRSHQTWKVFGVVNRDGKLGQVNRYLPPNFAAGQRQITSDDVNRAIEDLELENERKRKGY